MMENGLYLRKNLNAIHRLIRIVIGLGLIGWSVYSFSNWGMAVVSAIGGIQIFEGIIGY